MMKIVNGVLRGFSWVKGFIAGLLVFIATTMLILVYNDNYVIRDTTVDGEKKKAKLII